MAGKARAVRAFVLHEALGTRLKGVTNNGCAI